jgi:hypothetical protein
MTKMIHPKGAHLMNLSREDSGQGDYDFDEERSKESDRSKGLRQSFLSGVKATLYYGSDTTLEDLEGRYNAEKRLFVFEGYNGRTSYGTTELEEHNLILVLGSGRLGRKVIGEVVPD